VLGWWLTFTQVGLTPTRTHTLCSAHSLKTSTQIYFFKKYPKSQPFDYGSGLALRIPRINAGVCLGLTLHFDKLSALILPKEAALYTSL
jgi:hypothetical protein